MRRRALRRSVLQMLLGSSAALLLASNGASADPVYDVTVRGRRPLTSGSQYVVDAEALSMRRLDRPDKILDAVPGLLTAQHAGGGKSNQYLIRGFDADHGTDVAFFVDSVPMNMRSHAHGQGYAEMHWLIPETIERLDVAMGPYSVRYGDFATAGAVNLKLWDRVPESFLKVGGGSFDSVRTVGVYSPDLGIFGGEAPKANLVAAAEFNTSNGPFENPEDLLQYKGLVRFGYDFSEQTRIEAWTAAYAGRWNAAGQIPERLVDSGLYAAEQGYPGFTRWDSVDQTQGGDGNRQILQSRLTHRFDEDSQLVVTGWASHYALDLYSNFTFFLNDPVEGDGFQQRDDRYYMGGTAVYEQQIDTFVPVTFSFGLDERTDIAHVQLWNQQRRQRLNPTNDARVRETSLAGFVEADALLSPWIRFVGGVRLEGFWFGVSNEREGQICPPASPATQTCPQADGHERAGIYLPKANLMLSPFSAEGPLPMEARTLRESQLFLNWGEGYHSNDARSILNNPDETALPYAMGWEVGWRAPIADRGEISLAYWWLNLQSELVWVGDEGTTEPKGRSHRSGIEVAARGRPLPWFDWLSAEMAVSYSSAAFNSGAAVENAPRLIGKASVIGRHPSGVSAELDFTTLGTRYGLEDRSVLLHGYGIFDFALRYRRGPFEGVVGIDNFLNAKWRSSEFYYASRLQNEPADGVEDWHYTAGYPRNFRVGLTWYVP